ncbi:hypothetical protein B0H16DRAFT_1684566 [Mycena metata]|uniref:F-box domain-containing protein n=1 Tax=Mycena metata TaxID=1033252 RepID=A0AAD7JYY9_9AGAR|nr:hypothetical protein B0H16DRAFT_1684566 [Mycena metata]
MSVQDVQARIDELSAEIERQKEVLNQLACDKAAAQRQLNALRDPIAQLPLELSSEIFLQCFDRALPRPDPSTAPMLLLNICNAWANIALSTPALWAAIFIERPCHALLRIWLQRARDHPLSVSYNRVGESNNEVAVLGKYSKQLKQLGIFTQGLHHLNPFLAFGPLPCLETLEIGRSPDYGFHEVSITGVIDLLRLAPNLVEYTHSIATRIDYNEQEAVILPNLHTLNFKAGGDDDLLRYISLPSLERLSLRLTAVDDLVLFLKRN